MKLTEDDVFQILKFLEESSFDELNLEIGDLKLHVRKSGKSGGLRDQSFTTSVAPASGISETSLKKELTTSERSKTEPRVVEVREEKVITKVTEKVSAEPEEGLVSIKSPMLGTFYRRPAPGQPPYVDIGSFVKEDDTVCLLEVMKVFNSVKAGVRGYIVKICAESGELVEYGQTLFLVRPADNPEEKS